MKTSGCVGIQKRGEEHNDACNIRCRRDARQNLSASVRGGLRWTVTLLWWQTKVGCVLPCSDPSRKAHWDLPSEKQMSDSMSAFEDESNPRLSTQSNPGFGSGWGDEGSNVSHDAHIHAADELIHLGHVTAGMWSGSKDGKRSQGLRQGYGCILTDRKSIFFLYT